MPRRESPSTPQVGFGRDGAGPQDPWRAGICTACVAPKAGTTAERECRCFSVDFGSKLCATTLGGRSPGILQTYFVAKPNPYC